MVGPVSIAQSNQNKTETVRLFLKLSKHVRFLQKICSLSFSDFSSPNY